MSVPKPARDRSDGLREAGNPVVFIVGCLRSGTTLLRHVVDAHPDLAVVNETEWLPRIFEQRKHREQRDLRNSGRSRDVLLSREILSEVVEHGRFERLGLAAEQVRVLAAGKSELRYQEFVRRLFDAAGSIAGKQFVGEKSPGYVRHLPTLRFLWPKARFVHLIRDGRDVCLSVMAWKPEKQGRTIGRFSTWREQPLMTAGLWWEWHVRLGLESRQWLGLQLHELRYEALVASAEQECRSLCAFLDLPYEERMLRFHEQHGAAKPGARRGPGVPLTPGLRDWRSQLDTSDRVPFEAAAGDLLDELGYGRSVTIDAQTKRVAERVRAMFLQEAATRRRKVLAWTESRA
jgi:Sulfotransferase family